MFLEEENPIIRQTVFIINPKLSYQFDVNQTIHIYSLKKMIAAAANLQKNSFLLMHNNIDYTSKDESRLMSLFPNMQVVTFYIQRGEVEELDDPCIKIRINQYCPLHEFKYLSYYCFNCKKSICSICITDKLHQYHSYKEKCDYLQSSKQLVDYAFKNNATVNMDPKSIKQSEKIVLLSDKIHKVYFGKLHEILNGIEAKFNELIEYYNKTNKDSVNNMQDNLILFKRYCVKGLDELKEEIGIHKIMIDEDIFLTFHNKYTDLVNQQIKIDQDLKKVTDLNNVVPGKIEELVEGYYSQIYKVLYELLMSNTYQSIMSAIKDKDVSSLQEKDIVNKIIGNIRTFFEKNIIPKETLDTSNSNSNLGSTDFNLSNGTKKQKNNDNTGLFITPNYSMPMETQQQGGRLSNQHEEHSNKSIHTDQRHEHNYLLGNNPFIPVDRLREEEQRIKERDKEFIMAPILSTQSIKVLYKSSNVDTLNIKFTPLLGIKTFLPSCTYTNYKGMIYMSGGIDNNISSRIFFKYDITQNTLVRLPDMTNARANHSIIAHEDTIYAIGGNNTNSCEKYSLSSASWVKMNNMISLERRNAMLYINNNFLYAFLGKESQGYNETIERISIRSAYPTWEKVLYQNSQNINLRYHGCALHEISNELFFFGGKQEDQCTSSVFSYDFNTNSFTLNEQELDWKEYFIENKLEKMGPYYCQIAAESYLTIFLDLVNTV